MNRSEVDPPVVFLAPREFASGRDGGSLRTRAVHSELAGTFHETRTIVIDSDLGDVGAVFTPSIRDQIAAIRILVRVGLSGSNALRSVFSWRVAVLLSAASRGPKPPVVVVEYSHLLIYAEVVSAIYILDAHNVESDLKFAYAVSLARRKGMRNWLRRLVAYLDARALRKLEVRVGQLAAALVTVSQHDKDRFGQLTTGRGPVESVVATNGVANANFEFEGARDSEVAVFVAHLGWGPNVDAAEWLVNEVWWRVLEQRPAAKLRLIGRTPSKEVQALSSSSVQVIADVPDVLPYVGQATVATAPLLAAGGTRLKILEALAAGTPVVATPMGALGLEHLGGPDFRIERDPASFAEAIVAAMANRHVDRGRIRSSVETYRWNNALSPLMKVVSSVREKAHP